jgi:FtsP/CotA-like multicopper oxidase with cupredoxin domain
MFASIFNAPHPPANWGAMPPDYQKAQLGYTLTELQALQNAGKLPNCGAGTLPNCGLVGKYDGTAAAKALKDGRPKPASLWDADVKNALAKTWPQYFVGAFPNVVELPAYTKGGTIVMGQAPGTHWYHAHKHGSTSLHIFNGLAGALIIEGEYDDKIRAFFQQQLPVGRPLVEQVMVFQQITPTQNLQMVGGDTAGTGGASRVRANQKLINGQFNPVIQMQPGEVQLWRLVNAMGGGNKGTLVVGGGTAPFLGTCKTLLDDLKAAGFGVVQVAADGVQFSWDNYKAQPFLSTAASSATVPYGLVLSAGNTADILVQAPATLPATNQLIARLKVPSDNGGQPNVQDQSLFQVRVAPATGKGAIKPMHFFVTLGDKDKKAYPPFPDYLADLTLPQPPPPTKSVAFQWGLPRPPATPTKQNGPRGATGIANLKPPPFFMIDGFQFGEKQKNDGPDATVDKCMKLGDTEDWLLTNTTGIPHPFHIHVNPFQVISITVPGTAPISYNPTQNQIWQDTVMVPPGGTVRIRHKFADFTGTYVLHCHILAHEDRGMMQMVRVVKPADYPNGCRINGLVQHH